jgi:CHAT domain-containing protein
VEVVVSLYRLTDALQTVDRQRMDGFAPQGLFFRERNSRTLRRSNPLLHPCGLFSQQRPKGGPERVAVPMAPFRSRTSKSVIDTAFLSSMRPQCRRQRKVTSMHRTGFPTSLDSLWRTLRRAVVLIAVSAVMGASMLSHAVAPPRAKTVERVLHAIAVPESFLSCAQPRRVLSVDAVRSPTEPPVEKITVEPRSGQTAVLFGEELGGDIEWRTNAEALFAGVDSRPIRYGLFAMEVHSPVVVEIRAVQGLPRSVSVALYLSCAPDRTALALTACLNNLKAPIQPADGPRCIAVKRHAAAYAAGKAGDSAGALLIYREAASAWHEDGDGLREGAALLGATESLVRLGRYRDAIVEAKRSATLSTAAGNTFFALRAQSERCLALRELGERADARRCLAPLPSSFAALGEAGDAASASYSTGSMAVEDGNWSDAEHWLALANTIDRRAIPADVRGRLEALAGRVDMAAGRVASALTHLDAAVIAFEGTKNGRWLANVHLQLARLHGRLGAWPESRLFASDAAARLPEGQADRRRAEAYRAIALAEGGLERPDAARRAFDEARRLTGADAPLEALSIDLDAAITLGDAAALDRVANASKSGRSASERDQARFALAQSQRAWRDKDVTSAKKFMQRARADRLDLPDYLLLRTLQVRAQVADGHVREGLALLESEISVLRAHARAASAAGLRYLLGQRLTDLRRAWVDVYFAAPEGQRPSASDVWNLILATQPERLFMGSDTDGSDHLSPDAERVDRALASVLLAPVDDSTVFEASAPQRALVHYYASLGPARPMPMPPAATLESVQKTLASDTVVVAYAFGSDYGLALVVKSDRAETIPIAGSSEVRVDAANLQDLISRPDSSIATVRGAALRLSALLLDRIDVPLPARLRVVPDPAISGIPFALLTWPGQSDFLVETTAVSTLPAGPNSRDASGGPLPPRIDLLVDAGDLPRGQGRMVLPTLANATFERSWIETALSNIPVVPLETGTGLRAAFSARLQSPEAWVHVASHGTTLSDLQSYSGLWLASATSEGRPEFVSWLEAVAHPVRAKLVVLDACSLAADAPRARAGAAAFATAISAAGADDVVAALWPLSDAAAAEWVPTFYGALLADPNRDVAQALRAAQLRLRASRAHRNPY